MLASGAAIQIETAQFVIHDGSGVAAEVNGSAATYFSQFELDGTGVFGWSFTNARAALVNLGLIVFVDAEIDRSLNTFFNEYGEFVGLALPPGAGVGAIRATGWEIDEPGLVFGDILVNIQRGQLDNLNGVPSSAPDDVSLAFYFPLASLASGQTVTVQMRLSRTNIGGLRQFDPDSDVGFYLNGFATLDSLPPPSGVPEPSTVSFVAVAGAVLVLLRRGRK